MQKSKSYLTNTVIYFFGGWAESINYYNTLNFYQVIFKKILFMYIEKILIVLNNNFKLKKKKKETS